MLQPAGLSEMLIPSGTCLGLAVIVLCNGALWVVGEKQLTQLTPQAVQWQIVMSSWPQETTGARSGCHLTPHVSLEHWHMCTVDIVNRFPGYPGVWMETN